MRVATLRPVKLAVIIAARNEADHVGRQLDAIEAEHWDGDWEVIVVDNGSTDATPDLVALRAESWRRLRLVHADERSDKSYAVNAGVAASSADAFLFTDADDIVAPGWLAAAAGALRSHELITGPMELECLNPPWLVDSRGLSALEPAPSFEGLFPFARGNNYGLTRDAWERLGPLPEKAYPVEDIDLSLRARRLGIEVVGVPGAVVHYRYRTGAGAMWRQGHAYGRGRCRIARSLRDHGEQGPARFAGAKSWMWLVVHLPNLVTRSGRVRWTWVAANRLGQLRGSIENRLVYL